MRTKIRRHLCKNTVGVGVNRDGAFAEYLCIPVTNVWHADPSISMEILDGDNVFSGIAIVNKGNCGPPFCEFEEVPEVKE